MGDGRDDDVDGRKKVLGERKNFQKIKTERKSLFLKVVGNLIEAKLSVLM